MTERGQPRDGGACLPTAPISDCLDRLQAVHAGIRRISGRDLAGPASPIEICAGDSATIHRALEEAPAGSVLVIDGAGHPRQGDLGRRPDRRCPGAGRAWGRDRRRGARRRGDAFRGVPGVRSRYMPAGPHKGFAGRCSGPVQCGGPVVSPGDIVVGDADGVVAVPPFRVGGLAEEVEASTIQENEWMAMIRNRRTIADMLGLGSMPARPGDAQRDGN